MGLFNFKKKKTEEKIRDDAKKIAENMIHFPMQEHEKDATEEDIWNLIINDLYIDFSLFKYEKKSDDYSTFTYKERDLFRIKYTSEARWIAIFIPPKDKQKYIDNPLFSIQKNKNQIYWKSNVHSIYDYKEILLNAINFFDAQKKD